MSTAQSDDCIIQARWVIPVADNEPRWLDRHAVVVCQGIIAALLPWQQAVQKYPHLPVVKRHQHALIPGLINSHTHLAMNLLRGYADDLPLHSWLQEHIWPAEQRWVDAAFVRDGSKLAMAEMIRGGTTCFNDMYFFADDTAAVAEQVGMRASLGMIVIDFPTVWAHNADAYLHKGLALHDRYRDHRRIQTAFAPHAPYTVSNEPLQRIRMLADELNVPVHMHVHETASEISDSLRDQQCRPLQRLDDLGLVNDRLLAVHMTQLETTEISLLAERGCHVLHCPESNLKLASGFCPVHALQQAGVNVALGTDGAASNNDLDMLGEMRTAALLAKAVAQDASALPADTALRMATLNGAIALGLDERIGSLEVGKQADLAALDFSALEDRPCYDPISHLVYAASRQQVSDVWVDGKPLLSERHLQTMDEADCFRLAETWQDRILHERQSGDNA